MTIQRFSAVVFILLSSLFLEGCKKSKSNPFTPQFQAIMRESALSQAFVDDVLKISENILIKNNNARIETAAAALGCITGVDTIVTSATTKKYTITFDSSCTSYDGKVRDGIITVDLNGTNYNTTGSSLTIRFYNFYINGNPFVGKIISTNLGSGVFKVVVSDESGTDYANLTLTGMGKVTYWKATYQKTIFQGNGDSIIINNKYYIASYDPSIHVCEGVTTDGTYYTAGVTTVLLLDNSCTASGNLRYPISGEIEYSVHGDTRLVNYGDGSTCDNVVSMISGSSSASFSLY